MSLGGYDVVKTKEGKAICIALATTFQGVYLDTYNLEIELKPKLKILRHNIPPFIPLDCLIQQNDLQTNFSTFLDTVSLYLTSFNGRKQQLKLVKVQILFFGLTTTLFT